MHIPDPTFDQLVLQAVQARIVVERNKFHQRGSLERTDAALRAEKMLEDFVRTHPDCPWGDKPPMAVTRSVYLAAQKAMNDASGDLPSHVEQPDNPRSPDGPDRY